jgi:LPXTG-site transpeptidase (sortase) family protein
VPVKIGRRHFLECLNMKKIFLISIWLFFCVGVFGVLVSASNARKLADNSSKEQSQVANVQAMEEVEEKIGEPRKISIPSLNISSDVLAMGAGDDGLMIVPEEEGITSWWKFGAKPGEMGSAVIAGHNTLERNRDGVFLNLEKIETGEEIITTDEFGNELKFRVTDKKVFAVEEFPTKEVHEANDAKRLNLITCAGEYLASLGGYTHRMVVYTLKS